VLCNLRDGGRTVGETYKQARNNYHWNTKSKTELIGLTLFSYHLYGNPLIELTTPDYNLEDIRRYCDHYMEDFSSYSIMMLDSGYSIMDNLLTPYVKNIDVNLGSHSVEEVEGYDLLFVDGANQDYSVGDLILPMRLDTHEFPLNTIITNVSLISVGDSVTVTLDDLPTLMEGFIERECYENTTEAGIDYSHTFTEDSEIVIVKVNPVEVVDCGTGELKLYKTIKYQIEYVPYSPVLIDKLDYPEIVVPGSLVDLGITVSNVQGEAVSGEFVLKDNTGSIIVQEPITTSVNQFTLQFEVPQEETVYDYTLEFVQSTESKTQATFDIETAIIKASLTIPESNSENIDVELQINNYKNTDLAILMKSNLFDGDNVISSESYTEILNPGLNTFFVPYSGLNYQSYQAVIDIIYGDSSRTLTGTVLIEDTSVCIPSWSCTSWSDCDGTQTRTCSDVNECGVMDGKPEEERICTSDGYIDTLSDGSLTKDIVFNEGGVQTVYIRIPKNVFVTNARFTITGGFTGAPTIPPVTDPTPPDETGPEIPPVTDPTPPDETGPEIPPVS